MITSQTLTATVRRFVCKQYTDVNIKISMISCSHRMWSFRNCCFYSLIRGKFSSSNNTHDIRKETIVMDPMCMDERILCCTHSVTGIFMGSNNTVWQLISSICSFIPCSKKSGIPKTNAQLSYISGF